MVSAPCSAPFWQLRKQCGNLLAVEMTKHMVRQPGRLCVILVHLDVLRQQELRWQAKVVKKPHTAPERLDTSETVIKSAKQPAAMVRWFSNAPNGVLFST